MSVAVNRAGVIDRLMDIVGPEYVNSPNVEGFAAARDQYHPYYGDPAREPLADLHVQPASLDELRELVAVANELRQPLWVNSRGRNYGYGGPAGVDRGGVVVDLRRLDRIIDIDEKKAIAVVEPGVTPEMLMAEIQSRRLDLWMDSASSPYGSLIATALERGIGYGMAPDRFDAMCGAEVLLGDGTLIRTGTGGVPSSTTFHTNKYGYGPVLDGLFSQSNFGIVTKAGFWLYPQPEHFRHAELYISDLRDAGALMQTLADLRLRRVVENGASGALNFGGHVEGAYGSGGGRPRIDDERPGMRARIAFHGSRAVVDAKWSETTIALKDITSLSINTAAYDYPYDWSTWGSEARLGAGIPSPLAFPSWDGIHYISFGSFILPNGGAEFEQFLEIIGGAFRRHGREFLVPNWHMPTARTLICLVATPLSESGTPQERIAFNEVAVAITRELIEAAAAVGWVEYRTGTLYMDQVAGLHSFNDGSRGKILGRLKQVFDPNGILNNGKSGIWADG